MRAGKGNIYFTNPQQAWIICSDYTDIYICTHIITMKIPKYQHEYRPVIKRLCGQRSKYTRSNNVKEIHSSQKHLKVLRRCILSLWNIMKRVMCWLCKLRWTLQNNVPVLLAKLHWDNMLSLFSSTDASRLIRSSAEAGSALGSATSINNWMNS